MMVRSKLRRAASAIGLIVGAALMLYPLLTDVWAAHVASQAITSMESAVDLDDEVRLEQLAQAQAYNRSISGIEHAEGIWPYMEQLTWQTPYIGWVEIPKINVNLPAYHTASEEVLAEGIGHIEGTSLPVGGESSNCCLSAHSGLQTARMFDDVRKLEPGDKMCVHTLAEPYAYEVRDIEVVEPDDTSHLHIYEDGTDMLTLVTCTPLGVNSHRLLVHCVRAAYDPADFEKVPVEAYVNDRTAPPFLVGAAILIVSLAPVGFITSRRRHGKETQ